MNAGPSPSPPRLRLVVNARAERAVRAGHPWVFADSVTSQNRPAEAGELAVLYDRKDSFLGLGLYDPDSPLRVRMLHVGKPVPVTPAWWRQRLETALDRRRAVADAGTDGLRLVHGESDGWPGLVLDRYAGVLVMKLYTAAWLPRLGELVPLVVETLRPATLVLRLSRNIQAAALARSGLEDGRLLHGHPLEGPTVFRETGLRFEADPVRGQKTGFFLDQRENRRRVETLAAGRAVLNAFSFSGGFSVYAARGGATSVTDLDISPHALAAARRNLALNHDDARVAQCPHETVQADAFDWLEQAGRARFDLVVLDPPSLARREAERAGAIQAYGRLATAGFALLRPRGILVAASCSAHVSADEFFTGVRQAAVRSAARWEELATTAHPPDHPATFPEAQYLKCIYFRGSA